ncbi:MAG: hypothetical protein IPN29_01925 [Saprospiraceae bacterium]|nr:hypothetical protein [Saprospiraceae bacterium]
MEKKVKLTDADALIRLGPREVITFNHLKEKIKKAKLYREEYEHIIQLLAANIVMYNDGSDSEKIKLTVNINSLSQQLMLTPKSAGSVVDKAGTKADPLDGLLKGYMKWIAHIFLIAWIWVIISKLMGLITWSWVWVLIPVWWALLVYVLAFVWVVIQDIKFRNNGKG